MAWLRDRSFYQRRFPSVTRQTIMTVFQSLFYLGVLSCALAAKFAVIPLFGGSHSLFVSKFGRELVERGHKVTIFVGSSFYEGSKGLDVRTFNDAEFWRVYAVQGWPKLQQIAEWIALLNLESVYCDALLSDKALMEEIEKADLVIGELIYLCSSLVADKFSMPHVLLSPSPLSTPSAVALGHHLPPSYIPSALFTSPISNRLSFVKRVQNILQWLRIYVSFWFDLCPAFDKIKRKHNISAAKNIQETLGKVDLVISQSDFTLEFARPLLPNHRVVGPFLASPAQPLPEELESFIQSSGEDGAIIVSFGTSVDVYYGIDDNALQVMADAFSKLPQKVIWKLKLSVDSKVMLGTNTKRLTWLPQNDILGHPKTRLFIGHAGLNGLLESMYHGVPMICIPFFGDQFENAETVRHAGAGETLLLGDVSVDGFVGLIRKVLTEPRYRESAGQISKTLKLLPRHPVKEAADWVEYTQAQGGLPHLRPRELDLPFYQLYLLDVLFVALLILVAALLVVRFLVKSLLNYLLGSQQKAKMN